MASALSNTKSRRLQFEEQLRELQNDISHLSQRLAVPPNIITTSAKSGGMNRSSREYTNGSHNMSSSDMLHNTTANHSFHTNQNEVSIEPSAKGQMNRFKRELHILTRERDDALYKLHQAEREIENMSKSLLELNRWKTSYDRLQQDNEALKISLESSERIRKQQKDLIMLLQRSNSIAENSVLSFGGSMSTIPKGEVDLHSSGDYSTTIQSVDAENRSWLNGLATLSPKRPPLHSLSNQQHPSTTLREQIQPSQVSFSDEMNHTINRTAPQVRTTIKKVKPKEFSTLTGRRIIDAPAGAAKAVSRRSNVVAFAPRSMTAGPRDASLVNQRRGSRSPPDHYNTAASSYNNGNIAYSSAGRPPIYPRGVSSRSTSAPPSSRGGVNNGFNSTNRRASFLSNNLSNVRRS